MSEHQARALAVRIGAAAAIGGAILGAVVNVVHGDLPQDAHAAMTRVANSGAWGLLHLGLITTVLLLLVALLGLSLAASGPAAVLARGAAALALPGAAVAVTVTSIDGFATKALADAWAANPSPGAFGEAVAVETVQNALFHAEAVLFFGLPILLIGLAAQMPGGGLPRRTAWLAVAGGGGALVFGATGLAGLHLPGLLFNALAGLITVWALATGIVMWRAGTSQAMATGSPRDVDMQTTHR